MQVENLKYYEAVSAALRRALGEWPEALVFGEDVALPGGVFGCTKGLRDAFGDRVFDTPISEAAILGAAVGAAMRGRRPIAEIMWSDFTLVALDQLVNQAANVRYVSRGRLRAPLTVRTQQGSLPGSCAQHSQSLEAIFAHVPGLKVAMPSNAQDAYALLLAAIADDDPAIVLEDRSLYFGEPSSVETGGPIEAVGGARVVRPGRDVTVVAFGRMVPKARRAAEALAAEGIEAEVIDPRWVRPLDLDTLAESVSRTSRLVVVHEANVTGGIGAEVAAAVQERAFWDMDAPIRRVGAPDVRFPAAPSLQAAVVPSVDSIAAAVAETVRS